ncbi:MAG TPA: HAMP domain-containing sensor histidine kinase [Anaerolineales bacterium]|nr:HAMP domain-containing sensor histidine kinase [Anaerolineales bacterium]
MNLVAEDTKILSDRISLFRLDLIQAAANNLARTAPVRSTAEQEVARFYDLLLQACQTGNPQWLEPLVESWVSARTGDMSPDSSLMPLLMELKDITCQIALSPVNDASLSRARVAISQIFDSVCVSVSRMETTAIINAHEKHLFEMRQTLQQLDRSKADFIAIAAHELKTPLTLVNGYLHLLERNLPASEREKSATALKGINTGTRRLNSILDSMLDISLIENNMLTLSMQPTYIVPLLERVRLEIMDAMEGRNVQIILEDRFERNLWTMGDTQRLAQAFTAIVENGVKYTPDGGTVTISGRQLKRFADITVSDTGIGIHPEDQQRIFKKFVQIGDSATHSSHRTKFKGGGPGLGLAIAKGIIEKHDGTIWCESDGYDEEKLPGSTFHVMLPIRMERNTSR